MAESLAFTQELVTRATMHQVPAIMNISSQAVYGTKRPPLWLESQPAAPETPYAMAKHAAELMIGCAHWHNRQTCCSSLRMATLAGGQDGLGENELIVKFVSQALDGREIRVLGGQQRLTRLDVRDATSAILHLLAIPATEWQPEYNVDALESHTVLDLAQSVIELTAQKTETAKVRLVVEEQETQLAFGMSTTRFATDTKWRPQYSLKDTIASTVSYLAARRSNRQRALLPENCTREVEIQRGGPPAGS
jgi:nucleoside-diphosphate-sugar epimerase